MSWTKPDIKYWNNKFAAYMHDPFDKAFDIKGHVDRAAELLKQYGIDMPNDEFWKKADGIASGFERGQIESFKKDEEKSGAVDFLKNPILSHPTGEKEHLHIKLPSGLTSAQISTDLLDFIKKDIGIKAGEGGYSDSDNFKNKPERFAIARFFYTHLVLRFRLAQKNVGKIGALWHRLPADTRFPDHTIWQHNALVSAINSCFELAGNNNDIGMMVFSITPVQGFIAKARKLRDFWSGSVLLSWLAFEGIRWIMENLGPDHVLYPSLIDQPLVNEYLFKKWEVKGGVNELNKDRYIASFPNKFLFLIPFNKAEEISEEIKKAILRKWVELADAVKNDLIETFEHDTNNKLNDDEKLYIEEIFTRQTKNFWDIQWSAIKLLSKKDKNIAEELLPAKNWENQYKLLDNFLKMIANKEHYEKGGKGVLYSVSHSLCQSALAVQKTRKNIKREPEPGEKCRMCGEFEVLHTKRYDGQTAARKYEENIKGFWKTLKSKWDGDDGADFDDNDRLCSICLIKRIAYYSLKEKENKGHILSKTFSDAKGFPSTTYMALYSYFERKKITDKNKKREEAQKIHEKEDIQVDNRDRYYAILMMDGDNMGKLVSGETIAATWESVMHPEVLEKLKKRTIVQNFSDNWKEIFKDVPRRNLTPAIHAAISESLGDFAIYGVSSIIETYYGKLIYAGGDDVAAIMPVDTVIEAADEIQKYYKSSFKLINDISSKDINGEWQPEAGKLSINLGKGKDISISAGILICHHKENLSQMIKRTHELLDEKAKKQCGRDAIAIELRKRSGGSRYFACKWESERFKALDKIKDVMGEEISRSLAYKFSELEDGIMAIMKQENERDKLLENFITAQLKKSGLKNSAEDLSPDIGKVIIEKVWSEKKNRWEEKFRNDGLIIAGFLHQDKTKEGGEND